MSASFKYSATASPAASSCVAARRSPRTSLRHRRTRRPVLLLSLRVTRGDRRARHRGPASRMERRRGVERPRPRSVQTSHRRRAERLGTRSARRARARAGGYPLAWRASPCLACCGAPTPRLLLWHCSLSKVVPFPLSFRPVHASQKPKTVLPREALQRGFSESQSRRLWEKNTRIPRPCVIVAAQHGRTR